MKKILLGIILLLLFTSTGYCQEQPLQLTIKSDKEVYKLGEEIKIEVTMRNIGNKEVIVWRAFWANHKIVLLNENKKEVPLTDFGRRCKDIFNQPKRTKNVRWPLAPGQEVIDEFVLNKLYLIDSIGAYYLTVIYEENQPDGWIGTVKSNLIKIEIGTPSSDYIWIDEEDKVLVPFDTRGYTFYKGSSGEIGDPLEAFLKLVAVKGNEKIILPKTTSLKGYVFLRSSEDALAFARLFTNLDTHYLFEDADWIEVVNSGTNVLAGEMLPGWILKSDYERLRLFEPKVKRAGDGFIVERCLLNSKGEIFHSFERVAEDGGYLMEVKKIIQEDSDVLFPMYE